ncbi:MAG: acyl-homoserine-lactone synthase [Rhodobacter sp.]|nr:acyl-homoserine-lactone synthase [Rhodobacter sp.]
MRFSTQVVDLTDPNLDHKVYVSCLKLRRDVFVSALGWNLYESMGCEFDQYDTPASYHVVATAEDEHVIGCMRLLRTDNTQGSSTYMILDAHRGRIPNLPPGIMECELASDKVWEASRLAIAEDVPRAERNTLLVELIRAGVRFASDRGGETMLGLMHPVFRRVLERRGLQVRQFGPTADQRDGRICVLRLDFAGADVVSQ